MISKKIRIQVYGEDGNQLHDKLTEQDTTLSAGPMPEFKEGLLKMEICLFDQSDIDKVITYLKMVKGDIPLGRILKHKKVPKLKITDENAEDFRAKIVEIASKADSQEELTKYLRNQGFKFMTKDDAMDAGIFDNIKIGPKMMGKITNHQLMVRVSKDSKNPLHVKYDPLLIFFIKIISDTREDKTKVYTFLNNHIENSFSVKVTGTDSILNSANIVKFPDFMIADERNKFRLELTKLKKNPDNPPSKFFRRWAPFVEFKEKSEIEKNHGEFKND